MQTELGKIVQNSEQSPVFLYEKSMSLKKEMFLKVSVGSEYC